MKIIITFFVCTFFTLTGFAQYNQTQKGLPVVTISFTANGNRAYQITIDGTNYYSGNTSSANNGNWNNSNNNNGNSNNGNYNNGNNNNTSTNTITVNNLQFGQHNLQVFRLRNNNGNTNVNNNNLQPTYTNTFNLRQGYNMTIGIKNGQVQYTETVARRNRRGNDDNDDNRRDNDNSRNNDNRRNDDNRRNSNGGYNNAGYNQTPMADDQFSQLLQSVRSKFFQNAKVTAESDVFNTTTNFFTSYQIIQLLQLITAENTQLDLAKSSYRTVTDPANFTRVSNLFANNQTYKNDLDTYIKSNGGYNNGNNGGYNNGGYNNGGYNNGGYNNGGFNSNKTAMMGADFNQLLRRANSHFFAGDKVADVRSIFTNTSYYFNTSQIRQLLSLIAGESDKLDLAKLSYRSVTDAVNFSQLYDLFGSQESRNVLDSYVRSYRY
jgi:hypothetical protein